MDTLYFYNNTHSIALTQSSTHYLIRLPSSSSHFIIPLLTHLSHRHLFNSILSSSICMDTHTHTNISGNLRGNSSTESLGLSLQN